MKTRKITAFAAAAVLGAIMLTGCGNILNQNGTPIQPVAQSAQGQQSSQTAQTVQNAAPAANTNAGTQNGMITGCFGDVNGSGATLQIAQAPDGSYDCFVNAPCDSSTSFSYGFNAYLENSTLVYGYGVRNMITYDAGGTIIDNQIMDEGHSGNIGYSENGLIWIDSDGSSYYFA